LRLWRTNRRLLQPWQIDHHAGPTQLRVVGANFSVNLRADLHVGCAARQIRWCYGTAIHIDAGNVFG